jgi:hypothetical protein
MAKTRVKASVEKLNRTRLSSLVTTRKAPAPKVKAETPAQTKAAPEKKAKAEKKAPARIGHRRLLIAVGSIVKFGDDTECEKAARLLLDAAAKLGEQNGEKGFREYFEQAPSRLLPTAYVQWRKDGTAAKGALG